MEKKLYKFQSISDTRSSINSDELFDVELKNVRLPWSGYARIYQHRYKKVIHKLRRAREREREETFGRAGFAEFAIPNIFATYDSRFSLIITACAALTVTLLEK